MASTLGPRPLLLKDFLRDDPHSPFSDDFLPCLGATDTTVRQLLQIDLNDGDLGVSKRLQRSRSKAAAVTTISAIQKASEAVVNAIKLLPFSSARSPPSSLPKDCSLPRSFSKKLRRSFWKKIQVEELENRVRVRVREIMRWKSFADDEEEKNRKPLDAAFFSSSVATVTTSTSSSGRSSWSESDFTVRLSSGSSMYSGENEGHDGKNPLSADKSRNHSYGRAVGADSMGPATCCRERKVTESKEEEGPGSPCEEKEQLSPVSVLDFPFDDEETLPSPSSSAFHQSLVNVERAKQQLLQKIRRFECLAELDPVDLEKRIALSQEEDEQCNDFQEAESEEEDGATKLLKHFKASCGQKTLETNADRLLLSFFREGLSSHEQVNDELEAELLKDAICWMNGAGRNAWGVEVSKELHVKEMEGGGRWRKFADEEGELAAELEVWLVGSLLEELLVELLA